MKHSPLVLFDKTSANSVYVNGNIKAIPDKSLQAYDLIFKSQRIIRERFRTLVFPVNKNLVCSDFFITLFSHLLTFDYLKKKSRSYSLKRASGVGGGGGRTPWTLPPDPPLLVSLHAQNVTHPIC